MLRQRFLYSLLMVALLLSSFAAVPPSPHFDSPTATPPAPGDLTARVAPGIYLRGYLLSTPFQVIFSESMDSNSAQPALLAYPYVPGELTWSENNTRLTFTPQDGFAANRSYTIFLDRDLKSASGKSFAAIQQWQINVLPAAQVLNHEPSVLNLSTLRPAIRVNFDREMDHASVLSAFTAQPPAAFDAEWKDRAVIFHPRQPFTPGQTYTFTISRSAHDLKNIPLDQSYHWTYTLPVFSANAIVQDARTVRLDVNYELETKASPPQLVIDPPLAGKWTWYGRSAVYQVDADIPLAQQYTIKSAAPLVNKDGDTFTMPPVTFARKPPVRNVSPQGDMIERNIKSFWIDFELPMDHASAEAAFQLDPVVKGHFSWIGNELYFWPDALLEGGTTYTVSLAPSARDSDGRPIMLETYRWSFKTVPGEWYFEDPQLSFGCEGGNIQVINASGTRTIAFSRSASAPSSPITLSLYQLDLPRFAELYRAYYRQRGYYYVIKASDLIPTEGLKKAAAWVVQPANKIEQTRFPNTVPTGLYVLNASQGGEIKDQLFISLTTYALIVKHTDTRLWAWATATSGKDAPDLETRLYTDDGQLMREGKTGPDGIFETTMPKDNQPMLVAVRGEGDDIAVAGFSGEWNSSWWGYSNGRANDVKAYLYTDRPIYKPGHTVNFKAILRKDDDVRYSLPESGAPVKVRVLDPRGSEVQTLDLTTNDFGTVNGSFQIAAGAGLGDYTIQAVLGKAPLPSPEGGESLWHGSVTFKVEDYRKPEFQVQLSGDKDRYVSTDTIKVDVNTAYFFGEPVPNAELTIRRFWLQSWYWWGDIADTPQENIPYTWYPIGDPSIARTDAQGKYTLTTDATVPAMANEYGYGCQSSWYTSLRRCIMGVEVTAKDANGQSTSGVRILQVDNAAEMVSLDTGGWLKKPGEKFTVTAQAVTVDGEKPVAGAELTLELLGWDSWSYSKAAETYALKTDNQGKASVEVTIPTSGSYQLRLSPSSDYKNVVSTSAWIYGYTSKDTWVENAWGNFNIQAEQTHLKPYQKTQITIQSDFSGPALLTFERGRVIHSQPIQLTAPLTVVDTEIIPEYAPNVFVVVNAWQPQPGELPAEQIQNGYGWSLNSRRMVTQRVELQVETPQKALNIAVTPEKDAYAPRQEAKFAIQVTNDQNQPVEAEVSLALVDEAIFALSGDTAGPIFNAFYGRRDASVITSDSLAISRMLGMCGGGRGGGGGGPVSPANPRSDFPDTAAWYPAVRTDSSGKASVTVTLPDSLTTWRVLVKAVTLKTQVGEGMAKVITRQPVVVQPVLPRSLTVGDQFELGALVHNYASTPLDLNVELTAAMLEAQGEALQKVSLKPDEVRLVRWTVKAAKAGDTSVNISAASGGGDADAIRLPLTIRPRGMPDIYTQVGDFQDELSVTLVAPETMLDISSVEVKLSRSVAGSLLDGIAYLTGYPYGCVEQTMSRALPNAVVGRAFTQLGVDNPQKEHLDELISQGLQRLYGFQHTDGGWGWWHDDDSTPYQTAWVVFGLSATAEAGYPVDSKVIQNGVTYLQNSVSAKSDKNITDARERAYVLYSLAAAGKGSREETLALLEQLNTLDSFSQAGLALALHKLGEEKAAQTVLDALVSTASREEGRVFWEGATSDGEYNSKTMSSSIRSTAMALDAFVQIDPNNALIPDIVRYLMAQRTDAGWGSTNETAYTVLALTDHLQSLQKDSAEVNYQVALNGQSLTDGKLAWNAPLITFQIPAAQLKPGINLLKINQTGAEAGHLFYTITSRMFLDQPEVGAAGKIEVTREYLSAETGRPVLQVKTGDLIRVRLTAKIPGGKASYVIVEDPLPGGLEALNERLNNSTHYGGSDDYGPEDLRYRFLWDIYGYNQKEVYGDKVSFFVTQINSGTYSVDYLARASQTGTFLVPPAQVYAMYDDTLWGRSASGSLAVAGE